MALFEMKVKKKKEGFLFFVLFEKRSLLGRREKKSILYSGVREIGGGVGVQWWEGESGAATGGGVARAEGTSLCRD